jgi:hypothetical protein
MSKRRCHGTALSSWHIVIVVVAALLLWWQRCCRGGSVVVVVAAASWWWQALWVVEGTAERKRCRHGDGYSGSSGGVDR